MFRAYHAPHQEKTNCINTASGNCHSVLVGVSNSRPAHDTATNTE